MLNKKDRKKIKIIIGALIIIDLLVVKLPLVKYIEVKFHIKNGL